MIQLMSYLIVQDVSILISKSWSIHDVIIQDCESARHQGSLGNPNWDICPDSVKVIPTLL